MAVTGTETVVVVLCTAGAPSASASVDLTRVRSVTDCVVSLDVVSGLVLLLLPSSLCRDLADGSVLSESLVVVCTQLPLQRVRWGLCKTCVESSRMLWLLSPLVCGIASIAMLRVVVTKWAEDC